MPPLYTTIGPFTLQTFTLAVGLSIIASVGIGLWRVRRGDPSQTASFADAYLAALIGGMIGARLFHVLLNFDYFSENLNEAPNLAAGGLDWHGAVIGGLVGLYLMARLRRGGSKTLPYTNAHFYDLVGSLTLALPLIGLGGWYGCLAGGCGYGKEVDTLANYSSLAASETADVFGIVAPRYNTQVFGMVLCALALLIVLVLMRRKGLSTRGFWFTLALLSAGMFMIGFFRGDHTIMLAGLRADQWLDAAFVVVSGWLLVRRSSDISFQKLKAEG